MTVKIKDENVFAAYKASLGYAETYKRVWWFMGNVREDFNFFEVKKVINAIFEGAEVEFEDPKFKIRIARMNGNNGHQYVTSGVNSNKRFACGENNSHVICGKALQEFTRSDFQDEEWEYFKGNPEVYKFEEVEE